MLTLALDFVSTMVSWPWLRGLPAGTVSPTRAKAELVRAVATPAPLRRSPPPGQALHWDPPTRPLLMSINTGLPLQACPSPPLPNASNLPHTEAILTTSFCAWRALLAPSLKPPALGGQGLCSLSPALPTSAPGGWLLTHVELGTDP